MIKVKLKEYKNDDNVKCWDKQFNSFEEFQDFLISYSISALNDRNTKLPSKITSSKTTDSYLTEFYIDKGLSSVCLLYVLCIETEKGIEFSNGQYTNKQKHISNEVLQFLDSFKKKINQSEFNFVK